MIRKNWQNYYLSFLANFLICLGAAIVIALLYDFVHTNEPLASDSKFLPRWINLPIWLCNIAAIVGLFFSFRYFLKNTLLKKFHVPKKFFILVYIGTGLSFVGILCNIIFSLIIYFGVKNHSHQIALMWVCIGIDGGLWIVSNTLSWYGCTVIEIKHQNKLTKASDKKTKSTHKTDNVDDYSSSAKLDSFV